jgi:hypothetical protein
MYLCCAIGWLSNCPKRGDSHTRRKPLWNQCCICKASRASAKIQLVYRSLRTGQTRSLAECIWANEPIFDAIAKRLAVRMCPLHASKVPIRINLAAMHAYKNNTPTWHLLASKSLTCSSCTRRTSRKNHCYLNHSTSWLWHSCCFVCFTRLAPERNGGGVSRVRGANE